MSNNLDESSDFNDEANGDLSTEVDDSNESDTDVSNDGKEDINLDRSASLDNNTESDTDDLKHNTSDACSGLRVKNLTATMEA